jgi:hypothetical protein
MDAFWTVYSEKPSLVGAGLVAIAILEGTFTSTHSFAEHIAEQSTAEHGLAWLRFITPV